MTVENREGTIDLTLGFVEYRAVGAALVNTGDQLVMSLITGSLTDEEAATAGQFLDAVTAVIEQLRTARDAVGWGEPATV